MGTNNQKSRPTRKGCGFATHDEMLEIAEFGLPMKWQKAMVEHDFDCSQKTIDQIIDFAERQETIKALEKGYSNINLTKFRGTSVHGNITMY